MNAPLALIVAITAALQGPLQNMPSAPSTGTIRGQVSSSSGAPLRFAVVEIADARGVTPAPTDSSGGYVLRNVPPGWHMIRAQHFDHAPHEIEILVTQGKEILYDFTLDLRPLKLPPVETHGVMMTLAFRIVTTPTMRVMTWNKVQAASRSSTDPLLTGIAV